MNDAPLLTYLESLPPQARGETFCAERDGKRLNAQCLKVKAVMEDGQWHTLADISLKADAPEASVSARLRDLRKFGLTVERVHVERGLWRYRVIA